MLASKFLALFVANNVNKHSPVNAGRFDGRMKNARLQNKYLLLMQARSTSNNRLYSFRLPGCRVSMDTDF